MRRVVVLVAVLALTAGCACPTMPPARLPLKLPAEVRRLLARRYENGRRDWLAGSRQHILELIVTRVGVLGILYVLGFEKTVMDLYIVIVGFQAVFNHANVSVRLGPLRYVIVTPNFHHWPFLSTCLHATMHHSPIQHCRQCGRLKATMNLWIL